MIVDALLLAEPHMQIANRVNDPERFLYLTDHIMKEIEMSQQPVGLLISYDETILIHKHRNSRRLGSF
jgi:hypothetical protein